ncbi:MAG TPA: hypothetical protein VD884_23575 [Ohtaekwangia sp.]|nr:hypothetical protein [Ohtaekwangia sp.]
MKITKFFFVSLLVLFFSCSEDEPSPALPTVEGLTGSWNMTAIDYSGTSATTFEGSTIKATFTGKGKNMDYTTAFSMDPNAVVSEGSYTIELKTTVAGQTTTEDHEFNDAFMDGTWELDGRTLIITNDGVSQEAIITKQTDDVLEAKVNIEESFSESEITVTTKVKAIYKFRKADQ